MGVTIKGLDSFKKKINESYVTMELRFAMEDTVEFTENVMRDTVENTGTDKTWSRSWKGRSSSGRGRVDTGKMRDSIDSEVEVIGDKEVVGRVGWLKGSPEYTKFQEYGFRHWITGQTIAGMFATREGAEQGFDELLSNLEKAARRVFK